MNKAQAKKIAQSGVTYGELKTMLRNARDAGAANDARGRVNESLSRACIFNILWKGFVKEPNDKVVRGIECLGAQNAIREFGEYGHWEIEVPKRRELPKLYHEPAIDISDCPF